MAITQVPINPAPSNARLIVPQGKRRWLRIACLSGSVGAFWIHFGTPGAGITTGDMYFYPGYEFNWGNVSYGSGPAYQVPSAPDDAIYIITDNPSNAATGSIAYSV